MNEQFIIDVANAVMEKLAGRVIKNVPMGSTATEYTKQPYNGAVGAVEKESTPADILQSLAKNTVKYPVGSKPRGFWGNRMNTYAKNKGFSPEHIREILSNLIPSGPYAEA